jgi:shikimate kinase
MTTRRAIALIGASGSGKTVIGARVAERTGWRLFDTDSAILAASEAKQIDEIFAKQGEAHFRQLELACLDELTELGDEVIVATGGGMPAIPGVMEALNSRGQSVYLKASVDTLWQRLNLDPANFSNRPLLQRGGRDALQRLVTIREPIYEAATVTLDTDQLSVDEVCAFVVTQIELMS